jgi:hypothetical protein
VFWEAIPLVSDVQGSCAVAPTDIPCLGLPLHARELVVYTTQSDVSVNDLLSLTGTGRGRPPPALLSIRGKFMRSMHAQNMEGA